MVPKSSSSSFAVPPASPPVIFGYQRRAMEDGAFECDLNIEWPARKSERGRLATANVRAYSDTTCDHINTTIYWGFRRRSSQGKRSFSATSSTEARTIQRPADACRRVATQDCLTRGQVVTGVIDVLLTTPTSQERWRCEKNGRKLCQLSRIAKVHLQLSCGYLVVVGDPNISEVPHGKQGTLVTPVNGGHSSENHVNAACEVHDSNTAKFCRITVRTKDPQREPCGPGPLSGLQPPPRLPDFSALIALHHPRPHIARPPMRRRKEPRREGRLTPRSQRRDDRPPPATRRWRRVGTLILSGRVVDLVRCTGGALELEDSEVGTEIRVRGGRLAAPRARPASRARALPGVKRQLLRRPLGQFKSSTPSSSLSFAIVVVVVVVVVGVVVILWRGGPGDASTRRALRRLFQVLPDHDDTDVMRLWPPKLCRTTACGEVFVPRLQAAVVASSSA
ncbi:hypothetical protein HPB51_005842 [Rhipicephalus microplus]|uniref:Uncharacterized protein n=1 Tax=Rhipicephalus microplus TaxID=6941 RepID=A0A9J6D3Y8_RHIMP|nr:hypothetical protein HPB51_005842 [Rhipicephalus microplus]